MEKAKNQEFTRMIEEIRYREKLNQSQIAERLSIDPHYLSDIKNGRFPLTDDLRIRIYGQFPYLHTHANPSYSDAFNIESNAVPTQDVTDIELAGGNRHGAIFFRDKATDKLYMSVPHVPYAARGEYPNLADSLEPNGEWGREVYEVDRKASGNYISFDVRGDSMDNGTRRCLQDGDKVMVRELERDNWRTLRAGDHRYWVIVFGSSVLIKQITDFDPTTGIITCHSLNPSPEYHDFQISLDEVRHLYYVIRTKLHDEIG